MSDSKEIDSTVGSGGGDAIHDKPQTTKERVLEQVMSFAMSDDFEKSFEDFAEANKGAFLKSLIMEEGAEHPMEWHTIYLDYLHTFEGKIERFIGKIGFEINDFYEECKNILDDGDVWGETRFFLEALLATSEYENFVMLMKGEMSRFANELETNKDTNVNAVGSPKDRPTMLGRDSKDTSPQSSPKSMNTSPTSKPDPLSTSSRMDSKGFPIPNNEDLIGSPKNMLLERLDSKGVAVDSKGDK
jgi:hypothetical protein